MDTTQTGQLFDSLQALLSEGKEAEAKALLMAKMEELPEEVQGEIILALFSGALKKEEAGMQALRDLQERALTLVKALEKEKEKNTP